MRRTTFVVLVISALVVIVAVILSYTAPSAVADREREARLAEAKQAPPAEPPPSLTVDALVAQASEARIRVDVSCEL
ncbi:MAG: hypothetical protein QNK05_17635, partial [Myxococcota bacterium]|nr:hypothetical protein [Myxococcota bacterium]